MGKIEKLGRVSSESVKKYTGRDWSEWVALLDRARAKDWPHREITELLRKKYKLTPWWQQGVAMGYEFHHGKRVEGRNAKGLYAMVATKTVPLSQKETWNYLASEEGLAIWLRPFAHFAWKKGQGFEVDGGIFGEVRTLNIPSRLRLSWQEATWERPSIVQVNVHPRKGAKCMIAIQHESIPGELAKEKLRARWKQALERIAKDLGGEK